MKFCKKCRQNKELSAFYLDKRRNKVVGPCKKCRICASNHNWRKNNPDKTKKSDQSRKMKSRYGLSLDGLVELWKLQDRSCAICHRAITINAIEKSVKPHIDHCHVTGVVRGLLCLTCNTGLGMFGDSVDLLGAASSYLQRSHVTPVLQEFLSDSASVTADNKTIVN